MIVFEQDDTVAHNLDPRTKLAIQIGFAVSALSHTSPIALLFLTGITGVAIKSARVQVLRALWSFRFALIILAMAPLVSMVIIEPPWIRPADGVPTTLASYRVVLILLFSTAYIRSTSTRESRAAIQHTIPGKPGQLLGMGVSIVFRFFPILQEDLSQIQKAYHARLGSTRGSISQISHLGLLSLNRALHRADTLSVAMESRCFSWNPTLPVLQFKRGDVLGFTIAILLFFSAFV